MNTCVTTHQLDFEAAPWEPLPGFPMAETYSKFRIGTCEGLWTCTKTTYDILAVTNSIPGNGHFEDVMQWFIHSCKRDKLDLRFLEIMNKDFKAHLLTKRKFKKDGPDNAILKLKNM